MAPSAPRSNSVSLAILALTLGSVTIGTDVFGLPGILPTIAAQFDVSIGTAGQLIAFSSLAYAVGSPVLVTVTAAAVRRRLLIGSMLAYALAALAAALASDFLVLAIARVAAALIAGVFFPIAAAAAASLAGEARRGRALAVVYSGTATAVAITVPACIAIAAAAGWQAMFAVIAGMALLTASAIAIVLPPFTTPPPPALRDRLKLLGECTIVTTLIVTIFWMAAGFTVYTYLHPVLTSAAGVTDVQALGTLIFAYGAGGIAGSIAGGIIVDRWGARTALLLSLALLSCNFLLISVATFSALGAVLLMCLWGIAGWGAAPAQQALLVQKARGQAAVALALNASATYIGIALGAAIGGATLELAGVRALGFAASICSLGALLLVLLQPRFCRRSLVHLSSCPRPMS